MPRILLVTHYFPAHGGGVEKVAGMLASELSESRGWEIVWVASNTDAPPANPPPGVECVPVGTWNLLERFPGIPWPIWPFKGLRTLWRQVCEADIVHLHDALYFGSAFAWLFARLHGIPVIVTQHVGTIPYRSALLRTIHALANRTLGRVVLSTADQTVFESPAVRKEFESFVRFRVPPVNIPNGVDTQAYKPDGPVAKKQVIDDARKHGRRVLLFVGRFVEKKGLNTLRELVALFPDDLWVLVGWGPIDPDKWGSPNVLVLRGVTGAELAQYYRAADLFILPSVGEGFPLAVQEAMACGTPALIGEETAKGCPEARSLLYVEKICGDAAVLWAEAINRIFAEPAQLQKRRKEVAAYAQDNWSWESAAAKYAGLVDGIVQFHARLHQGRPNS